MDFSGFLPRQSLPLRRQGNDGTLLKKSRPLKYFDIGSLTQLGWNSSHPCGAAEAAPLMWVMFETKPF
jgi:hypothetical protein